MALVKFADLIVESDTEEATKQADADAAAQAVSKAAQSAAKAGGTKHKMNAVLLDPKGFPLGKAVDPKNRLWEGVPGGDAPKVTQLPSTDTISFDDGTPDAQPPADGTTPPAAPNP
jgi:hypothetical protein